MDKGWLFVTKHGIQVDADDVLVMFFLRLFDVPGEGSLVRYVRDSICSEYQK